MESFDDATAMQAVEGTDGTLAPESFWAWQQDPHGHYTHVIPVAAAPNFDPRSTVGRCRWELAGSRPLAGSWAEHRHCIASRLPFQNFRYLVAGAGGEARCLCESGMPQYDHDGAFCGYRGTTRDVTQQWLQECRLQETEDLLQATAAVARFGSWSLDVASDRLTWSRCAPAQRGAACEACVLAAPDLLRRYAPEYRALLHAACRRCVQEGTPFDLEVEALTIHGRRKWLRVIGVAVRGPDGAVARVQGAFQDIHRSKAAARAQRQTQEHLRATLDSLTDGFFTLDRQWRITYANPAAVAILGMPICTLVGQVLWDAFPGAEHGVFGQHYREASDQGHVVRFEAEYPPLSMWLRVSAFPSRQGIAISFTDITAARRARQQLLRDNADLERHVRERTEDLLRMNRELASFTHAMANDLRAPLAHIDGFSRALAERLPPGADARLQHFAGRVRAGVARMEGLLAALLELSHVGRSELCLRHVDLSAIARDTVEDLQASRSPAGRCRWRSGAAHARLGRCAPAAHAPGAAGGQRVEVQCLPQACTHRHRPAAGRRLLRAGQRAGLGRSARGRSVRAAAPPGRDAGCPRPGHRPGHRAARGRTPRRQDLARDRGGTRDDLLLHAAGRTLAAWALVVRAASSPPPGHRVARRRQRRSLPSSGRPCAR